LNYLDLKKMIKHEDRQRRRVRLGHDPQDTVLDSATPSATPSAIGSNVSINGPPTASTAPSSVGARSHRTQSEIIPRVILSRERKEDGAEPRDSQNTNNASALGERKADEEEERDRSRQPRRVKSSQGLQGTTALSINDPNLSDIHSSVLRERNADREDAEGRKTNRHEDRQRRRVTSSRDRLDTTGPSVNDSNLSSIGHPSAVDRSRRHDTNHTNDETSELLYILGNILGEEEEDKDPSETGSASTRKTLQGPPESVKRDPVALYHFYKKIWDKQSFPGDNRHMRLRWYFILFTSNLNSH
jgi:hypothetical protein